MGKRKKKKSSVLLRVTIITALLGVLAAIAIEHRLEEKRKAAFALYPSFGISIPTAYPIHGIDVSTYQEFIDWPLVKQMNEGNVKISFAFIKATEGIDGTDKSFMYNWQMARQAGIVRGAYHFFIASKNGTDQARNFINTVKLEPGDLPPAVDVEQLYSASPDSMRSGLQLFLTAVEDAYHVRPLIYSNADFYRQYLAKYFHGYPLWVAHYNIENAKTPKDKTVSQSDWLFWQHSQDGRVNGIVRKTDFDVFAGNSADFAQILVK